MRPGQNAKGDLCRLVSVTLPILVCRMVWVLPNDKVAEICFVPHSRFLFRNRSYEREKDLSVCCKLPCQNIAPCQTSRLVKHRDRGELEHNRNKNIVAY